VKELRLNMCQKSASSEGARSFVENHYVALKKSNPELPILIRECSGIQPVLTARFAMELRNPLFCLISLPIKSWNHLSRSLSNEDLPRLLWLGMRKKTFAWPVSIQYDCLQTFHNNESVSSLVGALSLTTLEISMVDILNCK